MARQLGPQRGFDHPAGQLREQPTGPRDLLRLEALESVLERVRGQQLAKSVGRPQTNGHVERLHRTILEECRRPAFARYVYVRLTGLRRDLHHYLYGYNHDRVHHGRLTQGRIPADIVYGAHKMEPR